MPFPGGMFGAPVGISNAEADIRAQQLHELAMQKGGIELKQAQLALTQQEAMMTMLKQATEQQGAPATPAAQAMNQIAGDPVTRLAGNMDMFSDIAARAGNIAQAKDYAIAGSTLRKNAAEIQHNKMADTITKLNLIGGLMEGVHDEATWRQANAMYQLQTGEPTPYSKLPYNPRVVDELRQGVMSAKDRALAAAAKAREKTSEATAEEARARVPLIRAQQKLAEERTNALKKTGAVTQVPKAGEVKTISDMLIEKYPELTREHANTLALPVAERMVGLMKSQNIPKSQAAAKAYQEAESSGDFGGLRPASHFAGKSPDRALDLPDAKEKLKTNMYYKGKGQWEGRTLLWTGAAFVPVGKGPGEVSPTSEEEGETDDSEEEESAENEDTMPAREPQ